MNIAVIPARGGSKRIPRKNIKVFCGKPVIAYPIQLALASGLFDHVVVSTDDDEIASMARHYGAEVPFQRPSNLADDYTPTIPVVVHAITACEALDWSISLVCCIYPGAPLLQQADLSGALALLRRSEADYVFAVAQYSAPVQRSLRRAKDGRMSTFLPEYETTRTQDLEPSYYDAGQFYWGTKNAWLQSIGIHTSGLGYIIPAWRSIDIDTEEDWTRAELIFRLLQENKGGD